jgi:hypothetical protein
MTGLGNAPSRPAERDYSHRDVADKLGIRPDSVVAIAAEAGAVPPALDARITARTGSAGTTGGAPDEPLDVVLLAVDGSIDLTALLHRWRPRLALTGGIWLLTPKRGQPGWIDRAEVIAADLAAGLVDNKICSVDEVTGAIRFVVPRAKRGAG